MKKLIVSIVAFLPVLVFAQQPKRFVYTGASANAYKGDLSDSYQRWTPSVHVGLQFNHKKRLNGALNLSVGRVVGQAHDYEQRLVNNINNAPNLFFKTTVITGNYELHFNIIKNKRFTWYISQGIGLIYFDPQDAEGFKLVKDPTTRDLGEDYGTVAIMLPTQMGLVHYLNNGFGVGLQAGWYNPATDYLDNVSKWGKAAGNDNIVSYKLFLHIPMKGK